MSTAEAWLATYMLHSTALLSASWLVARRVKNESWRELLWRCAMLGSLLTSAVAMLPGHTPLAGAWRLDALRPAALATGPVEQYGPVSEAAGVSQSRATRPGVTRGTAGGGNSARYAVFGILGVSALLLLRLWLCHRRLHRMLADRTSLRHHPAAELLAPIAQQARYSRPVRLSVSNACRTPVALRGGEICVPERFLAELDEGQQRVALAHELAHLVRRDPDWHLAVCILEAVFFFQPLNRLARRHLRQCAERMCDDWAVQQTGSAIDLARCLAVVATWMGPPLPVHAPAFAHPGSALRDRVEQLLSGQRPNQGPSRTGTIGMVVLVAGVGFIAPAFTPRPGVALPVLGGGDSAPQSDTTELHTSSPGFTGAEPTTFQPTPLEFIRAAVRRHYPEARSGALRDREIVFLVDAAGRSVLRTFTIEEPGIGAPYTGSERRTAFTQYEEPAELKEKVDISGALSDIHPDAIPAFEIIGGGLLPEVGEVGVVVWYHVRGYK